MRTCPLLDLARKLTAAALAVGVAAALLVDAQPVAAQEAPDPPSAATPEPATRADRLRAEAAERHAAAVQRLDEVAYRLKLIELAQRINDRDSRHPELDETRRQIAATRAELLKQLIGFERTRLEVARAAEETARLARDAVEARLAYKQRRNHESRKRAQELEIQAAQAAEKALSRARKQILDAKAAAGAETAWIMLDTAEADEPRPDVLTVYNRLLEAWVEAARQAVAQAEAAWRLTNAAWLEGRSEGVRQRLRARLRPRPKPRTKRWHRRPPRPSPEAVAAEQARRAQFLRQIAEQLRLVARQLTRQAREARKQADNSFRHLLLAALAAARGAKRADEAAKQAAERLNGGGKPAAGTAPASEQGAPGPGGEPDEQTLTGEPNEPNKPAHTGAADARAPGGAPDAAAPDGIPDTGASTAEEEPPRPTAPATTPDEPMAPPPAPSPERHGLTTPPPTPDAEHGTPGQPAARPDAPEEESDTAMTRPDEPSAEGGSNPLVTDTLGGLIGVNGRDGGRPAPGQLTPPPGSTGPRPDAGIDLGPAGPLTPGVGVGPTGPDVDGGFDPGSLVAGLPRLEPDGRGPAAPEPGGIVLGPGIAIGIGEDVQPVLPGLDIEGGTLGAGGLGRDLEGGTPGGGQPGGPIDPRVFDGINLGGAVEPSPDEPEPRRHPDVLGRDPRVPVRPWHPRLDLVG